MAENKIVKNAIIVMLCSVIAKFSSFFVELLVASELGVTKETDAFYMVYGIVQIIYPMISIGIWKVFLPEYKTGIVLNDISKANEITHKLLSFFTIISAMIILLAECIPQVFIFLFAPGFDSETVLISERLLKIVAFILVFNTVATFTSAILQSHDQFTKAQVKDIIFHIPSLVYLLVFRSDSTVDGLALSIVCGSIIASVSGYVLARKHYRFRPRRKIIDKDVIPILKKVPVACLTSIINQLNNVIDKVFASTLATGAVSCLNYGSKLIHLFDGLFSTAISTALFPYITELVANNDMPKLRDLLKKYIVFISLILIPISSIICVYSREIVEIVFGHGKFDQNSVEDTALVLLMYGIGLLLMCLTTIINDLFYILKRTKILLWTTIANIISNIILDFIFVYIWGIAGLSLATTLSLLVSLIMKFYFIKDIFVLDTELIKRFLSIILYCGVSLAVPIILQIKCDLPVLLNFIIGVGSFGIVYIILVLVLNKDLRELSVTLIKSIFSRRGRKK